MKKLLVIDANSILNRCFYGVAPLSAPDGLPTNAIYGMMNVLLSHIEALKPDYAAAAYDVHHPTFRHEMYTEYKAGRHETPPELLAQFPYSKEVFEAMGVHVVEKAGYEADDILGTLSKEAEDDGGIESYILTGDKDSLQLIGDNTFVLLATNRETVKYDRAAFVEKYGVDPSRFVDVKALMGDSSDNIPGVAGIGEKTALKLISEYGDIDSIYSRLSTDKHTPSLKAKLEAGEQSAYLSRTLARIKRDAPIDTPLSQIEYKGRDEAQLYSLFSRFGFSKLIAKMGLREAAAAKAVTEKRELEDSSVDALISLAKEKPLAVCECDGALLCADSEHTYISSEDGAAARFLSAEGVRIICHDIKALKKKYTDIDFHGGKCFFDVMLAAYIEKPQASTYTLEDLAAEYLAGASDNAHLIYRLYEILDKMLTEKGELSLLHDIEIPTALVLADMELFGFKVDTNGLESFRIMLEEFEAELSEQIYFHAQTEFNINSPKQLGEVLFEKLKLPCPKKTKSGYSTASDVLEKLKHSYPIVELVLEYRHVSKLRGTYAVGLLSAADERHRVHTTFQQCVTATGRLSSTDPNLQNIPIRTKLGREMRKYFIPEDDNYVLIDADYSQIELRILAHMSSDEQMCRAFCEGEDIHTSTASAVFGVPVEMVSEELRKRAKAVNFGIVYGIGAFSLAQDLGISNAEAKKYIEAYLERFSGVDGYLRDTVALAYKQGYVSTISGRRREIPELSSQNKNLRNFGERVAMNSPIQGSAADIIKIAMVNVDRALREQGLDARIILQVHDELVLESHTSCADRARDILVHEMENAVSLTVPLPVDVTVGKNWFEN